MKRFTVFFLAALLAATARADFPLLDGEPGLTIVTTTLGGESTELSAAALTVITREDIERSNARSLPEILRGVPGLHLAEQGSSGKFAGAFMRGSDPKHTLVLVDGVPVNDPAFGLADLAHLSLDRVERIEVMRGAGSVLHGSNAGGGVIHIITRDGAEKGLAGDLRAAAGNLGARQTSASAEGGAGGMNCSAAVSYDARDNHFPNDAYLRRTLSGALRTALANHSTLRLSARRFGAGIEIGPQFNFDPMTFTPTEKLDDNAFQKERQALYALRLSTAPPRLEKWSQDFHLSFWEREAEYRDPRDPDWDEELFSNDRSAAWRAQLTERWRWSGTASSALGAEWEKISGRGESHYEAAFVPASDIPYNGRKRTLALFGEQRWEYEYGSLTLGFRHERHKTESDAASSGSIHATTWRAAAAHRFPDVGAGGKWRLVFATSFRHPSIVDLYYPFGGNPDLKPEEGGSAEMGWDQSLWHGNTSLSVTVFQNRYRNLIQFAPPFFTGENVGRAELQGLEAAFSQKLCRGLSLHAFYAYLDASDRDTGAKLPRRPRHSGGLKLACAAGRLDGGLEWFRAGTRSDANLGGPYPDRLHPYNLLTAYGTLRLRRNFWLELRGANLLNEDYEKTGPYPSSSRGQVQAADVLGYPMPGRSFTAGLRWRW